MIGLIFRGETNNAADVFSALHRDRSIKPELFNEAHS